MSTALISICIPTYNGEKYLQEALDSVKNQTYKNIEVIISDDQSKDNTLNIIKNFKSEVDFPVFIYSHEPSGIGANWNNCIKEANGKYIQFLFQDDILEKNCLEVKLNYIMKYNLMAVCSKRSIIDETGQFVTNGEWYRHFHDLQKLYLNLEFKDFFIFKKNHLKRLDHQYIVANIFGEPIAFLFDRKLFDQIGIFNTTYKQILDIEYAYRILKEYPIGLIEESLFRFRLHDEQATSINSNLNNSQEYDSLKKYIIKYFYKFLSFNLKKELFKERYPILYKRFIQLRYLDFK
ncbi:glycosyltransferase family 2 protein [Chishuiella changwenlii]|jgi:glycosyltransferase involved in cell wall biosynthesis|uniref:glycosyltransferase family 2 protein n=1 Tax=Chishuiella changwenlii TaxID=1434701 RepID=UPI002FD9AB28